MEYTSFNIYEALFWILLSGITFAIYEAVHWHARPVFREATIWFLLFGISDVVEALMGGLFMPELWWLILWKIICIMGIFHVMYRYLHLRVVIK